MALSRAARARFDDHAAYLAAHEPGLTLHLEPDQGRAAIRGTVAVIVGGTQHDFQIELRYRALDPHQAPDVYDPLRRFPPCPDRHIEPDSKFCMWLPQTAPSDFDTADGLALHLHRVKEFLVLQLMYEVRRRLGITPRWPGDAWGHGIDGHEEWVREQTARYPPCDLNLFRRDIAGGRRGTSPDARCPCRSGRTYRSCHRPLIQTLKNAKKDPKVRAAINRALKDKDTS